jgi:hypothetical protein
MYNFLQVTAKSHGPMDNSFFGKRAGFGRRQL